MRIGTRLTIIDTEATLEGAEVVVTDTIREGRYLCQIVALPQTDKFRKSRSSAYYLGGQVYVSDGQYQLSDKS